MGYWGFCVGSVGSITSFRACATCKRGTRLLLAPYYDTTLRLYDAEAGDYLRADNVLPENPALVQGPLTAGIHECIKAPTALSLMPPDNKSWV
jgi:hypothetical protein